MKARLILKKIIPALFFIVVIHNAIAQSVYIPDVPDLNQPVLPWWGLLPDNACAPAAAANICVYWDDVMRHSNAILLNSMVSPDSVPAFLYYFMDTHNIGDTTRANGTIYTMSPGTYTIDIAPGLSDYVRWDSLHLFTTPAPQMTLPAIKWGHDWTIETDKTVGFDFHKTEIDSGRPDIIVFNYWNPDSTDAFAVDPYTGDTIRFMTWNVPIQVTEPPHPHEEWFFESKDESVGHAVTGVGYIMNYDPDSTGPIPQTDWLICHDNWKSSPENIAIPWQEWIATISADPGKDTTGPWLFCADTLVYLDASGQAMIDKSFVVDSVYDNTGIDTVLLDRNHFTCSDTDMPQLVTVTAIDTDGNPSQCQVSVIVHDTISPQVACTDTTVYLDANNEYIIDSSYVLTSFTDNCEVHAVLLSRYLFTESDVGVTQQVVVTAYDLSGNSSQCQVSVYVNDTIETYLDRTIMPGEPVVRIIGPNPFSEYIEIEYSISRPGNISAAIFDAKGIKIESVAHGHYNNGTYIFRWVPEPDAEGGIYFFKIRINTSDKSIKLIYLKQ